MAATSDFYLAQAEKGIDALLAAIGTVIAVTAVAVGTETSTGGHEKRYSCNKAVQPW